MESDAYVVVSLMTSLLLFVFLYLMIDALILGSKYKKYRKMITDLFIAGKIRQRAEKEGISIDEEIANYFYIRKKAKKEYQQIDDVIEEELMEEIAEEKKKDKEVK